MISMVSPAEPKQSKMDRNLFRSSVMPLICATRTPSWQSWVQITWAGNNQHSVSQQWPRTIILELYHWACSFLIFVDSERLRGIDLQLVPSRMECITSGLHQFSFGWSGSCYCHEVSSLNWLHYRAPLNSFVRKITSHICVCQNNDG